MHKIVHELFELDLTNFGLSFVEENQWYSDQYFTKYSFPFPFKLTEELLKIFGYFLDDNNKFIQTKFNVVYYLGNKRESAVFEIESQLGLELEASVRYGFEEFPNWDKNLSELPLEVIPAVSITNIFNHAKTIIPQKWPAVNYNYPQLFTKKYDKSVKTWEEFQDVINNYDGTDFLINEEISSEYVNRNILQPLPYLLHILTQGFLDAGYTLKGDVLSDEIIKKILVYVDKDYFTFAGFFAYFNLFSATYTEEYDELYYVIEHTFVLEPNSEYKIKGTIYLNVDYSVTSKPTNHSETKFFYKLNELATLSTESTELENKSKEVDVIFTTDSDASSLTQIIKVVSIVDKDVVSNGLPLLDLIIEKVIPDTAAEVVMYDDVDLKRASPNCTFGKLTSEFMKFFNLELLPDGSDMYMNFIENKINYNNSVDLSSTEVIKPRKEFNKLDSFLLKFKKPTKETFSFLPVFQNRDICVTNEDYVVDDTAEIEIDILPLPNISKEFKNTAIAFDEGGEEKIYFCLYDGLQNGLNVTLDPSPLYMPNIHSRLHKKWINFRLNAIAYAWVFTMYLENINQIQQKIYAYGRYHVVKSLEKTQLETDLFEVEIETDTLN